MVQTACDSQNYGQHKMMNDDNNDGTMHGRDDNNDDLISYIGSDSTLLLNLDYQPSLFTHIPFHCAIFPCKFLSSNCSASLPTHNISN